MAILNLTQHPATVEQIAAGVLDVPPARRARLLDLLTVEALPTWEDLDDRAGALAALALRVLGDDDDPQALIGGAPFLMAPLERALWDAGIAPTYAFSRRESVETVGADGSVRKTAVFRHAGFVQAAPPVESDL